MASPKVAIITDWIYGGGSEMVVEALHQMYPKAPIYASYCSDEWRTRLNHTVVTGYLQWWPFAKLRRFLPVLRQWWFSHLDISKYGLIISVTGNGEAKFIHTAPHQTHLCYCNTPTHFYWAHYQQYLDNPSFRPQWLARLGLRTLMKPLRKKDYLAARKVDYFLANSTAIQSDIKTYYGRESVVVFPPVNHTSFRKMSQNRPATATIPKQPRCVIWGRLIPFKRVEIAIAACNQLKLPLTIMGSGPDRERLEKLAGPTITFSGFVSHEERQKIIAEADIFLFCSHEDFGIAPVEALAAGLPVIAYKAGGALDYIIDGKNGAFFEAQSSESLVKSIQATIGKSFSTARISKSAAKFSEAAFKESMEREIKAARKGLV